MSLSVFRALHKGAAGGTAEAHPGSNVVGAKAKRP